MLTLTAPRSSAQARAADPNARRRTPLPALKGVVARIGWLTIASLCVGCSQPWGPIPGGELDGQEQATPDDWSFTAATEDFQLETRPSDPYSVNVWAVDLGSELYVAAGGGDTSWAEYMLEEPDVRLRPQDSSDIYVLTSQQVDELEELNAVRSRFEEKYDLGEIGDDADDAIVFRLTPRQG